jgi:DNA modification methylase
MPPKKSLSTPASTPEQASTLAFDQIYHMDCLEGFRQLASGSADIVICDPP